MSDSSNKLSEYAEGVNILDPKQLLQLAQDTSEVGRYRLAGAVAQVFEERDLKETEQRLATEILLDLIRQAELELREALAERLAVLDNAPAEVIVFLANDEISVARNVLLHSPVLNDVDLIYIITSKGEEHWQSIASRQTLSPIVADRLIDTGDLGTTLNLIGNGQIVLQKNSMKKLIRASLKSETIQTSLLLRPEIESDLVAELYICVTQALRHEMSRRFPLKPAMIETALENLIEELSQEARGIRQVTPEMVKLAKRFRERGEISPAAMVKVLRRGQVSFFIALFAERVGFSAEAVVRLIQKDSGRPFALACRSLGMMKSEFASIFLLSRGIRTGDKIVDQRELAMALKYYDALKEFDVHRSMKLWAKNPETI